MRRIAAALLLIPPVLALLLVAPAWTFLLVAEAVTLGAVYELYSLASRCGYRPLRLAGYLSAGLLTASFYRGGQDVPWATLLLLLVVGVAAVARGSPEARTLAEVAVTVFGALYVGLLAGSLVGLRSVHPEPEGRSWVLFLLLVVLLGDSGAYYTGTAWGRRRLAGSISPKKTIEGFLGGIAVSAATAAIAGPLLLRDLDGRVAAGLGVALSLVGVTGDLFESVLKRSAGVKDASGFIPGHGGILDRLDSVLFSAPVLLFHVHFLHPLG